MKTLTLMVILMFSLIPGLALAQGADEEKEKQFELEEETVQIHDSQAEREAAKAEAKHQEALEKERKRELGKLQAQKKHEQAVTNSQLAGYRDRIVKAEKKTKGWDKEIAQIQTEIKKLNAKVEKAQSKAKASEDRLADATKLLNQKRQEKMSLVKHHNDVLKNTASADSAIHKLKMQYARLQMETRQLEGHLKLIEQVEQKKEAERERLERDVSSLQERKKAAQDAIRAHHNK